MAVLEYTIADFINRESWWRNRGMSLAKRTGTNNLLDNVDAQVSWF